MTGSRPRNQKGLLVLDALVWAGAFLGILAIASYIITEVRTQIAAENAGKYAAQVALAVRAKIASENTAALVSNQTGTLWLRNNTDCPSDGTAGVVSYLPICGFPETEPNFGMPIETDIVLNGTIVEGTVTMGPIPAPYEDRYDLLQTMRRAAQNADPGTTMPTNQTFISVTFDDPATAIAAANAAPASSPTLNLEMTVSNNPTGDPYIRADGSKAWNTGVTQNLDTSMLTNVGSISADGSTAGAGEVEMARFVDSNNNTFLLDPDQETTLNEANITLIKNDPLLDLNGDGTGDMFLSNSIIHFAGVVNQGGTVNKPSCPNGTPEIHGSIASIIATDNPAGGGGTYSDPKNMKGFAVFHDTAAETATTWTVYGLAFVDDSAGGYELQPPAGSLVRIQVYTKCGV